MSSELLKTESGSSQRVSLEVQQIVPSRGGVARGKLNRPLSNSSTSASTSGVAATTTTERTMAGKHLNAATEASTGKKRGHIPCCVRCREDILDQFVLKVLPDQDWHSACLKCVECGQLMDENCTCFVKDDLPYCKPDFIRLFGVKCTRCACAFYENDLVMRGVGGHVIYHVQCFRCAVCGRHLVTGDEYALRSDGRLLCRDDHEAEERAGILDDVMGRDDVIGVDAVRHDVMGDYVKDDDEEARAAINNNNNIQNNNNDPKEISRSPKATPCSATSSSTGGGSHRSGGVGGGGGGGGGRGASSRSHKSDQKTTRIRTVLNEKQLHTLRTCYGANPRPDALMKEQLVEMTGLNSRVIRVWFQNKRCKDKKRSVLMKQIQQQQMEKGIPMIATSPMCHEPPPSSMLQLAPIEIHQYRSPWKALSDFALQSELDRPPSFRQQLVRSFGDSSGEDGEGEGEEEQERDDDTVVSFDEPSRAARSRSGRGGAAGHVRSRQQFPMAATAEQFLHRRLKQKQHLHQQLQQQQQQQQQQEMQQLEDEQLLQQQLLLQQQQLPPGALFALQSD